MNARSRRRVAATLGVTGGALGALAGVVQATLGTRIPEWTGDKASPVALGLLTILASGIALLAAVRLRGPLSPARRLAAAAGLLMPGGLCFTTVGAMWYLPGTLLLLAGVVAVSAGDRYRTRELVMTNWFRILVSVLGAFELLMAVSAGPWPTIAVGVVGGLALVAAPWLSAARPALVLLVIGTLPFAVLTWWSLAGPLLAVLALAIGLPMLRGRDTRTAAAG